MKKIIATHFILVLFLICFMAGRVNAIPYNTGSLAAAGGGLDASDVWDKNTTLLTWNVDQINGGLWSYSYTFTVAAAPGISHVIIEVSNTFTMGNVKDGTDPFNEGSPLQTYSSATQGNSNPGLEIPVWGLKWNTSFPTGESDRSFSWTLITDRAPMWGDFYATGGHDTYALNEMIDTNAPSGSPESTISGKVLVPDSVTQVPEPSSLLFLGLGLIGLSTLVRKFKKN
jgi:hypothetical protein